MGRTGNGSPRSICPLPYGTACLACRACAVSAAAACRLRAPGETPRSGMAQLQLALDIGGTFTDVVMIDAACGALWTTKTPSTPKDPADGFFAGVEKILRMADTTASDVAAVF